MYAMNLNEVFGYMCTTILQDTGSELMLPDIKYYQEFGGEKIIFEKEETAKIKRIVDQGTCTYTVGAGITLLHA